jgi:hypothetical protein
MDKGSIPLTGGKSVHCISEFQMEEAVRLAEQDEVSSERIQEALDELEENLNRNELAALSFLIIRRLKNSA